ncbi:hypothetical protein HK096_010371, partial [Nowakowskiella sp. JEL0078]
MNIEEKHNFINSVLILVESGTKHLTIEKAFIKNKVASVFVETVKRSSWPLGNDLDLDSVLSRWIMLDATRAELALLILKTLAEEAFFYTDGLPDSRRKTLKTALSAFLIPIDQLGEMVIRNAVSELEGKPSNDVLKVVLDNGGGAGGVGWLRRVEMCVDAYLNGSMEGIEVSYFIGVCGLKCLATVFDWVAPKAIASTNVVNRITQLLIHDYQPIRQAAADCALVLFSRHFQEVSERMDVIWNIVLTKVGILSLDIAWEFAVHRVREESGYNIVKRLAQSISSLGEIQIPVKKEDEIPEGFSEYLNLLIKVAGMRSMVVSGTTMSVWSDLLKLEYLKNLPSVKNVLPGLLEWLPTRFMKEEEMLKDPEISHFASIDFDNEDEIQAHCLIQRQRALNIVGQIVGSM